MSVEQKNNNLEKTRILIIDDEEDILYFLKQRLERLNFIVKGLSKPIDFLTTVKDFKPDIILLDLIMPKIDGLTIGEMLNQDKDTSQIPIIVISALSKFEDVKKAYKKGVVGYFTKPIDFEKLVYEINKNVAFKKKGGI